MMMGGTAIAPPPLPDPLDATDAAMRPTGRRLGVFQVRQNGTGDFSTLGAAWAHCASVQEARRIAEGQATTGPAYRCDLILDPGEFVETAQPVPWVNVYAFSPETTRILQNNATVQRGTLDPTWGQYWTGVSIELTQPAPAEFVYPIHSSNRHTTIFSGVRMWHHGGGAVYGSDGFNRGSTTFYRSELRGGTNMHGETHTLAGQSIAIVKSTITGNTGWNALNGTAPDDFWLVDSTVGGNVSVLGAGSRFHRSASTVAGSVTAQGTTDTSAAWPIPTGGTSLDDKGIFGG